MALATDNVIERFKVGKRRGTSSSLKIVGDMLLQKGELLALRGDFGAGVSYLVNADLRPLGMPALRHSIPLSLYDLQRMGCTFDHIKVESIEGGVAKIRWLGLPLLVERGVVSVDNTRSVTRIDA